MSIILGIETSCDETGVGIVSGSTVLANEVASSSLRHKPFGGVIPEIAARAHLEYLPNLLELALETAQLCIKDIDGIAVTAGPGLVTSLSVGVSAAKALGLSTGTPVYGVNHLVGHAVSAFLDDYTNDGLGVIHRRDSIGSNGIENDASSTHSHTHTTQVNRHSNLCVYTPPRRVLRDVCKYMHVRDSVVLLASGGHSCLLKIHNNKISLLGETLDDAAGEAFDKIARLMGLQYPGGPAIEMLASSGNPNAVAFPRALLTHFEEHNRYSFSFSGLKTAVGRVVERIKSNPAHSIPKIEDIAASFQEAVADVLTAKTVAAALASDVDLIVMGGGVAANNRIREMLCERAKIHGLDVKIPPIALCTDNGAMIAAAGSWLMQLGYNPSHSRFSPVSIMPLTQMVV